MDIGGNADLIDHNGQTPLYYAIKNGKYDICEYLVKNGVNLKNLDKNKQTPAIFAKKKGKT